MRFITILSAAGALGVAGVLTFGAATTATAAPAAVTAGEPRVQGPFSTLTQLGHTISHGWSATSPVVGVGHGAGWGAQYTFPALNHTGEIRPAGQATLCLTNGAAKWGAVTLQTCDGSARQQWTYGSDRVLYSSDGGNITDVLATDARTPLVRGAGGTSGAEVLNTGYLAPIPTIADPTVGVISTDPANKSAVVGGDGEPGATIEVTGPDGVVSTTVGADGKWDVTVPGLTVGENVLPVRQKVTGEPDKTTSVTVDIPAIADLEAAVVSVDSDAKTAVVGGRGEPGAQIEVEGPDGTQTTTVRPDGTWEVTVPGLTDGDNPITVTQTIGTDVQTADLVVSVLASPIVDPAIAGGAGVAAIAALGTVFMMRRKRANA